MDYHTDLDGNLILDEDGNPIDSAVCICAAWNPFECVCGAWDDVDSNLWADFLSDDKVTDGLMAYDD